VIIAILVLLGVVFTVISQPVIDLGFGFNFNRQVGGLGLVFAIFIGIVEFIVGGLGALGVYAVGELLYLAINVEENTRFSALLMRDRMTTPAPMPPVQSAPRVPPAPVQQQYVPPPVETPPPYVPPPSETPPPYVPPES
jgi:hypothetical protein